MIPKDYRLERVAERIAARLETVRRTYEGDPKAAQAAFEAGAQQVIEDVITEFRADGFTDHPDRHEAFLRTELLMTFLPRYSRLATRQTQAEATGYGLGFLHGPLGRVVLFFVIVIIGGLLMRAPMALYVKFGLLLPLLFAVFLPDVVAWASRVRYQVSLREILSDMAQLQDRALDYAPRPPLSDLEHD